MELKNKLFGINKSVVALFIFAIFWIAFVTFTGTLNSGYHLTDDHELLTLATSIKSQGFVKTLTDRLSSDFTIRLRPFYFINRIVMSYFLGINIFSWSIYCLILGIFSSYFLFLFLYVQGYKFYQSVLFPFLVLVGSQAAVFWKLGPAETIGIFMLSVSLYFLAYSICKSRKIYLILSVLFMLLASLSKESFALFIPAYMLILLAIYFKVRGITNIKKLVTDNLILIFILSIILLVELYLITFKIGTNKIGYAGVDDSMSFVQKFGFIYRYLRYDTYNSLILFGLFLLVQNIRKINIKFLLESKNFEYILHILIFASIALPQLLLYAKSGIFERYLLPLNLGLSYALIFTLHKISLTDLCTTFTKRVFVFAICFQIIMSLKNEMILSANNFTTESKASNQFLNTLVTNYAAKPNLTIVLSCAENYEFGWSIWEYLKIYADIKNVNFYKVKTDSIDPFLISLEESFYTDMNRYFVDTLDNRNATIAVFPFTNNKAVVNQLYRKSSFIANKYDKFYVFTRKY